MSNQAVQGNGAEGEASLTGIASRHNFHEIPIYPVAPAAIQSKLAINQPGDEYEQEADRVSERVMRMPERQPQGACACGGEGECAKCQTGPPSQEQPPLQAKRAGSDDLRQSAVPPIVHEVLGSSGQALDRAARGVLEPRFGLDFSGVRVHTDATAAYSAQAVNALAYTLGQDIVFGKDQYQPGTSEGQRLLAHELTHVVQQSKSGFPAKLRAIVGPIARSPGSLGPAGALIQRSAKFVAGSKPEDQNLAQQVIAQNTTAADALPVLNGTVITIPDVLDKKAFEELTTKVDKLIAPPTPNFNVLPGKAGIECSLDKVGSNEGSYLMHLPTKPPWSQDTTLSKLRAALGHYNVSVPPDCTGDGDTNLTVEGDPDSATLLEGIKAHEEHHAKDYEAAFNDTILAWDQKVTALVATGKKAAEKFQAKDKQGCAQKIIDRVGGSRLVAAKFLNEIVTKATDFHKKNPLITPKNNKAARAGPSCAKSWIKMKL